MKIKAKFKGKNSLGYENGKTYNLLFHTEKDIIYIKQVVINIPLITRNSSYCPYSSLRAFLNNWQVLD
jgi:hypothetical protein